MEKIKWGIIGCGDVTEVKSGPAFNKVKDSALVAVMRRDAAKAKDYAERHGVPSWYNNADDLINDPEVNAIYIATPPSSHEEYALAAIEAGKPVYVEKPMSVSFASANKMAMAAHEKNIKMVVAHYRRAWPLFKKVKQLLEEGAIGNIRFARIELYKKSLTKEALQIPGQAWRVDAAIAGGGLFNDLSPHQLDIIYYLFGEVDRVTGISTNQAGIYASDDIVAGNILFKNGIAFDGLWCFNADAAEEKDYCEIIGSEGKIGFSFFEQLPIQVTRNGVIETISFDKLQHVQQPMIEKIVEYFLGKSPNPCSGEEGAEVMRLIEGFTQKI